MVLVRDMVSILQSRLASRGYQVSDGAVATIVVDYEELRGHSVEIVRSVNRQREILARFTCLTVYVRVRLRLPQEEVLLCESISSHPDNEIEANANDIRPRVGRYRRRLYQQAYARSLTFLRSVQLPSPNVAAS